MQIGVVNAAAAPSVPESDIAQHVITVQFCLSKVGLVTIRVGLGVLNEVRRTLLFAFASSSSTDL